MEITALTRAVSASDVPPERLAANPNLSDQQKVAELSRQFESMLLRQILQNARKTVIESDLEEKSVANDIYDDMVTSQLAEAMSKSGSFGLARALEKDLTRQLVRRSEAGEENAALRPLQP
jgi:Rod binding domain-containing protein